jgi:hypothetical protein
MQLPQAVFVGELQLIHIWCSAGTLMGIMLPSRRAELTWRQCAFPRVLRRYKPLPLHILSVDILACMPTQPLGLSLYCNGRAAR